MATRRFRLRKLNLDEVSLVPAGDDPEAEVVLSKADPDKTQSESTGVRTLTHNTDKEHPMPAGKINKSDLDPEVAEYIESLESALDEVADAGNLSDDALADALAEIDGNVEAVLAKADPAIRELVSKAVKDAEDRAAAAEDIAKAERNERIKREFIEKAAAFPALPVEAPRLGEILKAVNEGLSEEDATEITRLLTAGNEAIAKTFEETGTSHSTSVSKSVESIVQEIRKGDSTLTYEQAVAKAYETHPDLYTQEH
jgi:hypothetical protein